MEIEIRPLGPPSIPEILALWSEAGLSFRGQGRDAPEVLTMELSATRNFVLGAFFDGELVGVALGTDEGRKGWINRVAVRPSVRRQGIAHRLIAACEATFANRGIGLTCCLIEDWNETSLALFAAEGYDLRKDVLYLRKPLQQRDW